MCRMQEFFLFMKLMLLTAQPKDSVSPVCRIFQDVFIFFTFGYLNRYRDQGNTKERSSLLSELLRGVGVPSLALVSIFQMSRRLLQVKMLKHFIAFSNFINWINKSF